MSSSSFSEIICAKCREKCRAADAACPKCGGALAKICGNCGAKNSTAKKYCDHCGTPLLLAHDPPEEIPQTEIRRLPGAPAREGLALPAAGRLDPRLPAPVPHHEAPPSHTPTRNTYARRRRRRLTRQFLSGLALILAAAAGAYQYWDYHRPQNAIPRAASRYLDALSRRDFHAAYGALSRSAQAHCSLAEFSRLHDPALWTWSDARITLLEPAAAVVKYRLTIQGQAPREDYLIFLREDGEWVRPYNWNLLQRVEGAFDRNDPDLALVLAQEAVRIDPRDPMARGYLCEAVYYRKVPAETERECSLALQLSAIYPSKLSLKSLYHLRAILGDTYKNALRRYPEAIAQYDAMLAFPALSDEDRCALLLARADARAAAGQKAAAAQDLKEGSAVCANPSDAIFIRKQQASLAKPR